MEYDYINIKPKNNFNRRTEKWNSNQDYFTSNRGSTRIRLNSLLPISIPSNGVIINRSRSISDSLDRIRKSQKDYLKNSYWGIQKRVFDIAFSLAVIVFVLSWVYPLMYILIKMESKGPLIFKQKRNGLNEKPFDCYKFRSMEINDYSESVPTLSEDPRITKIGKFIRKCSIDELPQFINVFKGEMTVVGPRPHMLSETNSFNKLSDDFHKRHCVKPGITGLAQINDCRGRIDSIDDLLNRLKYDLRYIKNASLLLDFNIVGKTFSKMIFGDEKAR